MQAFQPAEMFPEAKQKQEDNLHRHEKHQIFQRRQIN